MKWNKIITTEQDMKAFGQASNYLWSRSW